MKVIVAGAAIAGPATAIALQDIGIEAEIFEARNAVASDGRRLTDINP